MLFKESLPHVYIYIFNIVEMVLCRLGFCHKCNCQLSLATTVLERCLSLSIHNVYNEVIVLHWKYMNITSVYLLPFKV